MDAKVGLSVIKEWIGSVGNVVLPANVAYSMD